MKNFKNLSPFKLFAGIAISVIIALVASPYIIEWLAVAAPVA